MKKICVRIFKAAGCSDYEAERTSDLLVKANLRGHDSHGVIRVPIYVASIRGKQTQLKVEIEIVTETPTTALINGNWGLGQIVATRAMEVAIKKAQKNGVSVISIYNCSHIGRMADYAEMALAHDMISLVSANTGPIVTPYGGKAAALGTNPICYAIPAGDEKPIVLDMATSVAPIGKVMVKQARGEKAPPDWLVDSEGQPTTNVDSWLSDFRDHRKGAILPFGGSVAYKGYGLCLVVDILCGLLSGAGTGTARVDDYVRYAGGNGVFMLVIDISRFQPVEVFKADVDKVIRNLKNIPKASGEFMNMESGQILVAGEPERRRALKNLKDGIFIEKATWNAILRTANDVGVDIKTLE